MSAFLGKFAGLNGLSDLRSPSLFAGPNPAPPGGGQTTLPDPTAPNPVKPDPVDPDPVDPGPTDPDPDPVDPDPVKPDPDPDSGDPSGPPVVTETMQIAGGRVTNIQIDAPRPVTGVEITGQPGFGHASVNPDNSISLVMSGESASGKIGLDYTITYNDGTSQAFSSGFDVGKPSQAAGWGAGEHYMLETGADGRVVVETGDNHRKIYVGGGEDALSRSDIARLEGLKTNTITNKWLIEHPEYGGSEGMALDSDAGMGVWYGTTTPRAGASSNWLMLERGHSYGDLDRIITAGAMGESALHPMHITAWGEGEPPVLEDRIRIFQKDSEHIVFSGVTATKGALALEGENLLFDDMTFTGTKQIVLQNVDKVTIRDSRIEDIVKAAPNDPDGWTPADRVGGLYASHSEGLLLEDNFIHHNGWADDYREPGGGMPPSMFSHNIYLQNNTTDVTLRDNIIAQGASFGAQMRGGAFVEDNAFIDNNVSFSVNGGIYREDGPIGNFSFVADNLTTSAAYKTAPMIGGVSLGQMNEAYDTTLLDNIVAHLANPDDAVEFEAKVYANPAVVNTHTPFYDDTIVYNWIGSWGPDRPQGTGSRNVEGLDFDKLDDVTIQNYAAALLGRPDATIDDLMDYLSAQDSVGPNGPVTADDIIRYFQEGFGIAPASDTGGVNRFVPEEMSDGIRWDNRVNWERDMLPGQGEDVDLGGNRVGFGTSTLRIGELDLGPDGALRATSGKLTVADGIRTDGAGGEIELDGAGQIWTDGRSGEGLLRLDVESGRFVNTGEMGGRIEMQVGGDAQAILGTDNDRFDLSGDSTLEILGARARVGFDGEAGGTAVLRFGESAALSFAAEDGKIGHIGEFRSGAFGDAPDVQSGINLGGGRLHLDLGDGLTAGRYVLLEADQIVGKWSEIEVNGLRDDQNLRFELDHETDTMSLIFGEAGKGQGLMSLDTLGDMENARADNDLWAALTDGQGSWDEGSAGSDPDADDDGTLLLHA